MGEHNNGAGYDFGEAFDRMCTIVGIKTQKSLGTVLGISQPSVHYARTRQCIPTTWLLKLVHMGINPAWVLNGSPNKPYLQTTDVAPTSGPASASECAAPDSNMQENNMQTCNALYTGGDDVRSENADPATWGGQNPTTSESEKGASRFQSI